VRRATPFTRPRDRSSADVRIPRSQFVIPAEQQTVDEYIERLRILLASANTHIYIDTSFLVSMTALSAEARAEFAAWLEPMTRTRVHVPVWSAHEYLRHHVQDLHGNTLAEIARELNKTADSAFRVLKPYLDAQVANDPRKPAAVMTSARGTLIEIKRIADAANKWRKSHYDAHAGEVIRFINRLALKNPALLDWMIDIESYESARFEGRIPPGFQDRTKKESGTVGSNRFGDLVFWKEVLQHAREARAEGIIILSNDGKNDWNMGGEDQPALKGDLRQFRSGLPPLPRPHPMLSFEAKGTARVEDLMLVDQAYLAVFLRRAGVPCDRFFNAAVDIILPTPTEAERARRSEARGDRNRPSTDRVADGLKHLPTEDSPNVSNAPVALKMALAASGRDQDPKMSPLLDRMMASGVEGKGLGEFLTAEESKTWETRGVVWLARSLASRSIDNDPVATTYVSDILACFERLPHRTATALYLGVIAASYLDGPQVRSVPSGAWLAQVFQLQSSPSVAPAIGALESYFRSQGGQPVYLLNPAKPTLSVKPLTRGSRGGIPVLVGLQIGDIGVVVETQDDESRLLHNRFPERGSVSVGEVVGEACAMLGIPFDQVEKGESLERQVAFGPHTGIASPTDLQSEMEDPL
jgi:hypothetical protein